jgi:GxGYxYP putative glycoside hydrolase C-terminal domain/GxGYxYP third domain/GxGYxYP_N 1st domain/GxGYxYP_N second domain
MMTAPINRRTFIQASAFAVGGALVAWPEEKSVAGSPPVCPKSAPPARKLYAFRLDSITSREWDIALTLSCLQGIVNRSRPSLYLIHDHYDELWLEWLRKRGDIDGVQWLGVAEVFERFLPAVSQMYITDPAVSATVNVATMLAAVRGGLVTTAGIADQFNLPSGYSPDSSRMGLDLRTLGWKKDVEAYRWAYQEIGNQLSRQAMAVLDPQETALRDYLVEFKIPIFWISGHHEEETGPSISPAEEKDFAREILMKWPANIPCLGWPSGGYKQRGIGEGPGIQLLSQCAKFNACTAYDGYSPTVGNLSVHSGTRATLHRQPAPEVALSGDKVYYAFIRSDGDGWNFQRQYYRKLFDDPKHGEVPIGWQIGPTATDGQPDILDYYYKNARPGDYIVNALSGVGYIHEDDYATNYPAEQRDKIWREYIALSERYLARLDTVILVTYSEMRPKTMDLFARMKGIRGIFANYARSHETTLKNLVTEVDGIPVFRADNGSPGPFTYTTYAQESAVSFMVDEVRRWTPPSRPAFLYVFLANWLTEMGMAASIAHELGSNYVPVRPDQLVSLYRQSKGG